MAYTLTEVNEFYDAAKSAYLKALSMKEYTIKDRSLKRENVETLKAEMDKWKNLKNQLEDGASTGKIKIKRFVPIDN